MTAGSCVGCRTTVAKCCESPGLCCDVCDHGKPPATAATGVDLITAERKRQIDQEGYSPEHDRRHASSLAFAAAVYAAPKPIYVRTDYIDNGVGFANPWPTGWRKPNCSRLRELIRAGALIAAEIDRLLAEGESDGRQIALRRAESCGPGTQAPLG